MKEKIEFFNGEPGIIDNYPIIEAKDLKKIEKQLNAYVVKGTDGSLITVGHSYKRRRN